MSHKISGVGRDPQILRWDQRRCPPSSAFSCSWLNVLTPFAKLWGSADPLLSQVSFLTSWSPAPNIFCWPIQFSAWPHLSKSVCLFHQPSLPHLTAPRFAAGNPCCFGCACLAAPLMPEPKLKQSLPLVPRLCCCLAEQTQLCVQPQSKQDQGWAQQMPGMHQTATLGCWQGQGTARMEQLGHKAGLTSWRWHCWVCSHSSQQFSHLTLERPSAQLLDLKVRGVH